MDPFVLFSPRFSQDHERKNYLYVLTCRDGCGTGDRERDTGWGHGILCSCVRLGDSLGLRQLCLQ